MAIALGIGTLILLLEVNGLSINPVSGTVTQNGLIFINAQPEEANVILNGEDKGQTDTRLVMPVGEYDLELRRDGYRSWKRNFVLEGSSVERYAYPFLFPNDLQSRDLQLYASAPGLATVSPDRRWVVIQQPGSLTSFDVVDISSEDAPSTSIVLPPGIVTEGKTGSKMELVEWSTNNRHLIIKHSYEGGHEFILLDRDEVSESQNLNLVLERPMHQIALRDKKFDQYYVLESPGGNLVSTDLRTRQDVLVGSGVLSFKSHGNDVLLFASNQGAEEGKVSINIRESLNQYTLRTLPVSDRYLLDLARFDNSWYVAVGSAVEKRVYLYRNPFNDLKRSEPRVPLPLTVLRTNDEPEFVSFSAIARFVAIQARGQFAVYDAETKRQYRYDTEMDLPAGQKATWMDGHRLTVVHENKVNVFDYDGINRQTLVDANPAFPPFFDRDYEALFTISPSRTVAERSALVRTELLVDN